MRERLTFLVVSVFGCPGMVVAYAAMVLRNANMDLPIFRKVAILDIAANLVLKQKEIEGHCTSLALARGHLPSPQIVREMIAAHRRYKAQKKPVSGAHATSSGRNGDGAIRLRAASNQWYLFWLLQFYFYRSVGIANSERILAEIDAALTVEEFTPKIAGYLSAFCDLGLPLTLYLPLKSTEPRLTAKALPLFTTVLAKNGFDADFIKGRGFAAIYLETTEVMPNDALLRSAPRVAVFLASFYTLRNDELTAFVDASVMPVLREVQRCWSPGQLTAFCHPQDSRAAAEFPKYEILVGASSGPHQSRMSNFDIVVCGNTSVIEEGLDHGLPVVYCASLDAYRHDHNGYVKEGVVFDATRQIPSLESVTDFYRDSATLERLALYRDGALSHPKLSLREVLALAVGDEDSRALITVGSAIQPLSAAHFSGKA